MKKTLLTGIALFAFNAISAPQIVSSIYPLQQIANAVTGEETGLIADSYLSPHDYRLTPSDAKKILAADLVITVGEALMPQLHGYIEKRKSKATIIASKLKTIHLIEGEDEHEGHHHHHHHHGEYQYDPHLWLSPDNAIAIATAIAEKLSELSPQQQSVYQSNLAQFKKSLSETTTAIKQQLENTELVPYFVFHDAYRYFENTFNIQSAGIIRTHVGQSLRTKHISKLKNRLDKLPIACLFREPQFKSPIISRLTTDTNIIVTTVDPVGYTKPSQGYAKILSNIADSIVMCSQGATQ